LVLARFLVPVAAGLLALSAGAGAAFAGDLYGRSHVPIYIRYVPVSHTVTSILPLYPAAPRAVTRTATVPGPAVTVPGPAVTVTRTVTVPGPVRTVAGPAVTRTETVPGPTLTVTAPAPTATVPVTTAPAPATTAPAPSSCATSPIPSA
jgi:hypothetical protein